MSRAGCHTSLPHRYPALPHIRLCLKQDNFLLSSMNDTFVEFFLLTLNRIFKKFSRRFVFSTRRLGVSKTFIHFNGNIGSNNTFSNDTFVVVDIPTILRYRMVG